MKDLKEVAGHYADVVNGPLNGHGQCVSTLYGRSDHMMLKMVETFGRIETDQAITAALSTRK